MADCCPPLPACNSQALFGMLMFHHQRTNYSSKVATMLRLATLRFTTDGRLLGFDTGDWSMLVGGFVLARLVALFI